MSSSENLIFFNVDNNTVMEKHLFFNFASSFSFYRLAYLFVTQSSPFTSKPQPFTSLHLKKNLIFMLRTCKSHLFAIFVRKEQNFSSEIKRKRVFDSEIEFSQQGLCHENETKEIDARNSSSSAYAACQKR